MTGKNIKPSRYPSGFAGGLSVRDLPLSVSHPGKVFYVADGDTVGNTPVLQGRSGASDGNPGTERAPFKTLDYAIGQCTAKAGDVIFVLPGYITGVTAADAIDVDVSGITIIGLGAGSDQPKIVFNDAAGEFTIGATNVTIMGLNFVASVTVVSKGVNMENGADDCRFVNCRWTTDDPGTAEFEDALFNLTSDRMVVDDCSFIMGAGADADSAIHLDGACNGCTIRNTYVEGDYTAGCIEGVATLSQMLTIDGCTLMQGVTGGLNTVACITLLTGTTGFIQNTSMYTAVTNAVTAAIAADAMFLSNNTVSSTAETPPVEAELLGRGRLEVTIKAAIEANSGGDGEVLFAEGPVDIYGVWGVVTSVMDADEDVTITLESGPVLVALGEIHLGTAVGDYWFTSDVGTAATIAEVQTTNSKVWASPIRVTGTEDAFDIVSTSAAGEGAHTIWCLWSPVVAAAEVTNTE